MSQLKQKRTLTLKGEQAAVAIKRLQVILQWQAPVDLDLMAFFRAKDGRMGGVVSANYPGGSSGSLTTFPFMELVGGDSGVDAKEEDHQEELVIERLDDLAEVYICTLNYTDAAAGRNSAFANYDGSVTVNDDRGHSIVVPLNTEQKGQVAVIAKIDHDATGNAVLKNENQVMTLGKFFETIPGTDVLNPNAPPRTTTPPPPAQTATPTDQVILRWIEAVRLRAYDNPYIDKAAEKELLREVIAQGLSFTNARQHLVQICNAERYALASYMEEQAAHALESCVTDPKKKGIDQACCMNAVNLVKQSSYGHLKEAQCRKLVKDLISARQWPVIQGFLKGGSWFKDL